MSFRKALDEKYRMLHKRLDGLALAAADSAPKREGAQDIWSDLMSGKKRLLTKQGIFAGADAVKAALGIQLERHGDAASR